MLNVQMDEGSSRSASLLSDQEDSQAFMDKLKVKEAVIKEKSQNKEKDQAYSSKAKIACSTIRRSARVKQREIDEPGEDAQSSSEPEVRPQVKPKPSKIKSAIILILERTKEGLCIQRKSSKSKPEWQAETQLEMPELPQFIYPNQEK